MFPKVPDQHKPSKPLIPNGLGVIYVLASVVYIFLIYFFGLVNAPNGIDPSLPLILASERALILAASILFGGFLGMLDDWIDLKWRLKAFLPLIAAIPLISLAYGWQTARTTMVIPLLGITIDFGIYYYFIIIPILITIVTNTVNMLGGLNGLETVCPAIIMVGLMIVSGSNAILLICPLIVWLILAFFNFRGKIFVGNTGSFAIGITLAAFAVISDLKFDLAVSILPYVLNSSLILLTFFLYKKKANVSFDGEKLASDHRRSLVTLITYHRPLTERQVVTIISLLVAVSTAVALLLFQLLL